ncbi:hypothetical protein L1987_39224 [Smallanthus sonchifolius]|uniref:Uncharacterized protein n=1 Tax=Smallanthus sonchifolius TaxID=185202 RepID=A0ACB9HLF1_9ASTR|nr:hypothetical protein L1987_39224 [Smallanthus sonchifolius]
MPLKPFHEHVLIMTGLSRNWPYVNAEPIIKDTDEEISLLKYFEKKDLGVVKLTSRFLAACEVNILDRTHGICYEGSEIVESPEKDGVAVQSSHDTGPCTDNIVLEASSPKRCGEKIVFESSNEEDQRVPNHEYVPESDLHDLDRAGCVGQLVGAHVPELFTSWYERKAKRETHLRDRISRYRLRMSLQRAKNAKLAKKVKKLKNLTLDKNTVEHAKVVDALKKELEDARGEGEKFKEELEREMVEKLKQVNEVEADGWRLHRSREYLEPLGVMQSKLWSSGAHDGVVEGYARCKAGVALEDLGIYKPEAEEELIKVADELKHVRFPYVIVGSDEADDDAVKSDQIVGSVSGLLRWKEREARLRDRIAGYREKMRLQKAKSAKLAKKVRKLKNLKRSTLDKGREAIEMVAKNTFKHAKVVEALRKELEDARAEGEEKLKAEREMVEKLNGDLELKTSECVSLEKSLEQVASEGQWLNGELELKKHECVSLEKSLERVSSERRWLIEEGFEYVINRLLRSREYLEPLGAVESKLWSSGAHDGVVRGYELCEAGVALEDVGIYKPGAEEEFIKAADELKYMRFPYVVALSQCADRTLDELRTLEPIGMEEAEDDVEGIAGGDQENSRSIIVQMAPKQPNTGLFVGLNKGHVVTKKELAPRPSDRKGKTSKRSHFVRNLIREVAGFAPYEKRITELLKVGKDKRALKVAKRKLGTHKRAKKKREEMSSVLRKMRSGGGAEKKK